MRLRAVALVAVSLAAVPPSRAGELLGYGLRLEAGVEHDSNPARLENVQGVPGARPIEGSPALRLVSGADLSAALGALLLSFSGGLAGKRFLLAGAQPEDLVIAEARAGANLPLGRRWDLGLGAGYYDVFQRADGLGDARDFRSVTPSLRLGHDLGSASLGLAGGWRWFRFKPDPAFDFHGPTVVAGYRHTLAGDPAEASAAQWDLSAGLSLEDRRFFAGRCLSLQSCPPPPGTALRRDRFWAGHLDVSRTGALLLGGGLVLGVNRSNSYGESLWRLAASGRAVALLPWRLSLSARAELVATRYEDSVPVGYDAMTGTFVSIEDEGRSSLRLELVRPVGSALELGARYTIYSETPGAGPVEFRRQIFLLYLAVSYPAAGREE
jgi:hypothetical protein